MVDAPRRRLPARGLRQALAKLAATTRWCKQIQADAAAGSGRHRLAFRPYVGSCSKLPGAARRAPTPRHRRPSAACSRTTPPRTKGKRNSLCFSLWHRRGARRAAPPAVAARRESGPTRCPSREGSDLLGAGRSRGRPQALARAAPHCRAPDYASPPGTTSARGVQARALGERRRRWRGDAVNPARTESHYKRGIASSTSNAARTPSPRCSARSSAADKRTPTSTSPAATPSRRHRRRGAPPRDLQ